MVSLGGRSSKEGRAGSNPVTSVFINKCSNECLFFIYHYIFENSSGMKENIYIELSNRIKN